MRNPGRHMIHKVNEEFNQSSQAIEGIPLFFPGLFNNRSIMPGTERRGQKTLG